MTKRTEQLVPGISPPANYAHALSEISDEWDRTSDDAERAKLIELAAAVYEAYRDSDDVSAGPAWDFAGLCTHDFLPFLLKLVKGTLAKEDR